MGKLHQIEYVNQTALNNIHKIIALENHIRYNFYPPHPEFVVESMLKGFEKYWKGDIDILHLAETCYLRDISGLYQYFYDFLDLE